MQCENNVSMKYFVEVFTYNDKYDNWLPFQLKGKRVDYYFNIMLCQDVVSVLYYSTMLLANGKRETINKIADIRKVEVYRKEDNYVELIYTLKTNGLYNCLGELIIPLNSIRAYHSVYCEGYIVKTGHFLFTGFRKMLLMQMLEFTKLKQNDIFLKEDKTKKTLWIMRKGCLYTPKGEFIYNLYKCNNVI